MSRRPRNPHGRSARFAFDPVLLVAYLDTLERPKGYSDATHGRIIRRWRRTAQGVTREAAERILACYGVRADSFVAYCHRAGEEPVIRDKDQGTRR